MYSIVHRPRLDVGAVEAHYSAKDGVATKYVCSTSLDTTGHAKDVYYRDSIHPDFGNRYFGLYRNGDNIYICNADRVEQLTFSMVNLCGAWHYSRETHDYNEIGPVAIDGGRSYTKIVGDLSLPVKYFRLIDGKFSEVQ